MMLSHDSKEMNFQYQTFTMHVGNTTGDGAAWKISSPPLRQPSRRAPVRNDPALARRSSGIERMAQRILPVNEAMGGAT
jgi:hypothetical protein